MNKGFTEKLIALVEHKTGESVEVVDVNKNNGVVRKAIVVGESGTQPVFYIEQLYEKFGNDVNAAADEIASRLNKDRVLDDYSWISNWDIAKNRIVYSLVNQEMNENDGCPKIAYLDLYITFRVFVEDFGDGNIASVKITKELMECWGVSPIDLMDAAQKNTEELLPSAVSPLSSVLDSMPGQEQTKELPIPIFIVTNQIKVYGAAAMMYDGILERLAYMLQDDLAIIPSSVHEVLIIPKPSSPETLKDMKSWPCQVNEAVLDKEYMLSDNIYLYERETKAVKMLD